MKLPAFCLPSIRLPSGFRSCAVAFFTFALLGSGEARAELTQAELTAAILTALDNYGIARNGIDTIITSPVDSRGFSLGRYLSTGQGVVSGSVASWLRDLYQLESLYAAVSSNDLARISSFFPDPGDSQSNLAELLSQIAGSASSVSGFLFPLDFRFDSHGDELLVAAPDLESLLDDVYALQSYNLGGMYGLMQYIYDNGLLVHGNITVSGGRVSVSNQVDVNVLNWPDYFTGEYDQEVAEEITSAPSYESDWDSYVADTTDYAEDSEDDASEDSPYFSDVTNAVNSVVLDTDDLDESLRIRDEVFNPISDDLLPASVVNRNFSSDVLILPAVRQFHIPEIAWDGNDSAWQSFLTRSGSLMSSLYDVFYAIFVIWLIWREYNFYFRTM